MRPRYIVSLLAIAIIFMASAMTYASAKQEQVKPERPLPTARKSIPAQTKCSPPILIKFWVIGSDGKLKLSGSRVIEGTC